MPLSRILSPFTIKGATSGTTTFLVTDAVSPNITLPTITGSVALTTYTRQVFLTGTAATYTTPAGCKRIFIRQKAGGGGAAGSSNNTGAVPTAGTTGTSTSFNSITALGGAGAGNGGVIGGLGGTGGSGTASVRIAGATGGHISFIYMTNGTDATLIGGDGGGQGAGRGTVGAGTGGSGVANSGGGGGAPGVTAASFAVCGSFYMSGGGGEGEYAEILITSPAATYTYTVGAGGAGGTGGTNGGTGGAGGSGFIIVDEYY